MKNIALVLTLFAANAALAAPEPTPVEEAPLRVVYSVTVCRSQDAQGAFLAQGLAIGIPTFTADELKMGVSKTTPVNVTASDGEYFGGVITFSAKEYLPNISAPTPRIALQVSYVSPEGKRTMGSLTFKNTNEIDAGTSVNHCLSKEDFGQVTISLSATR